MPLAINDCKSVSYPGKSQLMGLRKSLFVNPHIKPEITPAPNDLWQQNSDDLSLACLLITLLSLPSRGALLSNGRFILCGSARDDFIVLPNEILSYNRFSSLLEPNDFARRNKTGRVQLAGADSWRENKKTSLYVH